MQLIVNKQAVTYQDEGRGPVVLMLHGWSSDMSTFDQLAAELKANHRVVRVDLPGFGASQLPPSSWTLDDYIDFVAVFCAKLKIKKLDTIVAHSLGGRISLKGVGLGKLQPRRLVLLAAHGVRESAQLRNRLFRLAAKTGKFVTKPLPSGMKRQLKRGLYRAAGTQDYLTAGPMKQVFSHIIRDDVRPEAAMIAVPTLLIYGAQDTVTPLKIAHQFHDLVADSELKVIKSAGHFVHEDAPDETLKLIKNWLA